MTAKEESEKLINALMPLTEQLLRKYGEFYPHGGYLKPDGEIVLVGAGDPDTDHPKSVDLIQLLRESLRAVARANDCRVAGIVFDVSLKSPEPDHKRDAIQVCIEHVDGYCVKVFFPYRIAGHDLVYEKTFAQEGKPEIFA